MPATMSKQEIQSTIDLLEHRKLVHVFCRLDASLPAISEIVAHYVRSRDVLDFSGRFDWRAFVICDPFAKAVEVIRGVKRRTAIAGFTHWDAAVKGRHGAARAVIANPISVQGITGNNLLFVLLRNHNEDIWNALWPAVVDDTQILAVNCELFSEKGEFAYVDWGE